MTTQDTVRVGEVFVDRERGVDGTPIPVGTRVHYNHRHDKCECEVRLREGTNTKCLLRRPGVLEYSGDRGPITVLTLPPTYTPALPTPSPADALVEALELCLPELRTLDYGQHHCRYCDAGTSNGWTHSPSCAYAASLKGASAARAAATAALAAYRGAKP